MFHDELNKDYGPKHFGLLTTIVAGVSARPDRIRHQTHLQSRYICNVDDGGRTRLNPNSTWTHVRFANCNPLKALP